VTAARTLRVAAVLDAAGTAAERHARALLGFLRGGLTCDPGSAAEVTAHVLLGGGADRDRVVGLAPARDVRVIRTLPHRPDLVAAAIVAVEAGGGADLYVFPGGPLGSELAARIAARTGGSVLTGVQEASVAAGVLTCRRAAYANHLTMDVQLTSRPWCIALDGAWTDAACEPPDEHVVHVDVGLAEDAVSAPAPFHDVEHLEPPPTGDLESARFLVVAGRGAGSRVGVERIAAAAARMGAALGVTRPVVMNAWASPDRQVGVSGTRTAPAVCVVAGASGSPAFLWGIERAGFIAAVDTDDRAPITGEADAVVIDDAVAVLEALADLLG